jgi:hypothetical protein
MPRPAGRLSNTLPRVERFCEWHSCMWYLFMPIYHRGGGTCAETVLQERSSIGAVTTFAEVAVSVVVADSRRTTTARGWPKLRPMGGPFEEDEDGYCGFKRSNWTVGPCQLAFVLLVPASQSGALVKAYLHLHSRSTAEEDQTTLMARSS